MTPSPDGPPPRPGRSMLLKAAGAALLIVLLTAGASSTAALLKLDDVLPNATAKNTIPDAPKVIKPPKPGKPQTILLVGSDHRWTDKKDPARSDTLMLVRLNPKQKATTVLSIPRDLQVVIPGHGVAKINDAYAFGGPKLTAATVQALTGLDINHIVNVNFRGFREVVNTFNCFYADIDRRYFHSNAGVPLGQRYDAIDIAAGYQKLCGSKALDYVRFRHADSDLTRAARQQDFLRAAKDQVSSGEFLHDLQKMTRIVENYTQTDKDLISKSGFLRVGKLAFNAIGLPVRQIRFPAQFAQGESPQGQPIDYVEASPAAIQQAVDDFMHGGGTDARKPKENFKKRGSVKAAQLVEARDKGAAVVKALGRRRIRSLGFPLRYPAYLTSHGRYPTGDQGEAGRIYSIRDRAGTLHRAYRLVVTENELDGQYYGIQGTSWRNPPLLADPSATRTVKGKKLLLFRAGSRLRFVAWRTNRAAYWISNSLNLRLSNAEMLAIATSLTTAKTASKPTP